MPETKINTPRRRTGLFGILLGMGLPVLAAAGAGNARHFVPAPVTITALNRAHYIGVLPTWRRISPVGTLISTPNFPTKVLSVGAHVLVLANGATPFQTVTWYSPALRREARLASFSGVAPSKLSVKTFASGSAIAADPRHTGPAGAVYSTNEPAKTRAAQALATERAQRNPHPIVTAVVSHRDLFQGLAAGPNGIVYATGGASDRVLALQMHHGAVHVVREYPLKWQAFPRAQYPYTYQGDHSRKPYHFYPDAVAVGPHGAHLYVTGMLANSLARIDLRTGRTRYVNAGPYPFEVVLADGGRRLAVSDWAGSGVTVLSRRTLKVLGVVPTGPRVGAHTVAAGVHPTAMVAVPGGPEVWVANANNDRIVEVDTRTLRATRSLDDSPYAGAPPGSYPDALAVVDGRLFVANAGNDDVAVYETATGRRLGLIPTGWYPSALTVAHQSLYVVAAKGFGTGANLQWQYIGNMMHGLLQKVPLQGLSRRLGAWTRESLANDGFLPAQRAALAQSNARTAALIRRHIHYVVFILRENKTFDEDMGKYRAAGAWANPHFDLFGAKELPNLYRMAAHGVLFANFMADGEVTAQGHQWTDGASDSDVVQRLWPEYYSDRGLVWNAGPGGTGPLTAKARASHDALQYAHRQLGAFANPWISYPQRLYLFNNLLAHHVSFEDFGENLARARDGVIRRAMLAHVDQTYPGWNRMIRDTERVSTAIGWLKAHPGRAFPHFIFIWIPDDHTAGASPCYYSPPYYVANNDHATAQLLHYLSATPQWRHMAVFLTEDDAQSGADHINAHRTLALAMGPWVKFGDLDTHPLSQVNIVRTIETVFHLPPMSQWDANAQVISGIWANSPRLQTVPVLPMQVPVQFNAGKCSNQLLLRREAAAAGHALSTGWLQRHTDPHGAGLSLTASELYTPTSILTVEGPEQMRQEWIASRGARRYEAFQRYLRAYAARRGNTLASYEANDGEVH
ncbi:MAG: bifunctional YncE family protein/alkaline phosphatase family protein [Steroidobacteraceae bacterium]